MAKHLKKRRPRRNEKAIYADLSPEEIDLRERREKKRRIKRRRQKFMSALFLALILLAVVFIFVHRKKGAQEESSTSIAENSSGLMAVGEAGAGLTGGAPDDKEGEKESDQSVSEDIAAMTPGGYEGATDALSVLTPGAPVDVTRGMAAVDLTAVEGGEYKKVQSAKAAMSTAAYFTGTTDSVNNCLQRYGEGKWHAIRDVMGEICVFYEGVHVQKRVYQTGEVTQNLERSEEIPFKVVFTVYEDGSFVVTEVSENGSGVDDWEAWLKALL